MWSSDMQYQKEREEFSQESSGELQSKLTSSPPGGNRGREVVSRNDEVGGEAMSATQGGGGGGNYMEDFDSFFDELDLGVALPSPRMRGGGDGGQASLREQIETLRTIIPGAANSDLAALLHQTVQYISLQQQPPPPSSHPSNHSSPPGGIS